MVIETFDLTKQYQGAGGCRDISITVSPGQVFGLLGPNGAGKSTLVKTLVGLLHPTRGKALVLGYPLGSLESRKKIGFLPEQFRYHEWLTGLELLRFHGRLYNMEENEIKRRVPEVFEIVGLKGAEQKKVGSYSKGMQQRIGIGCALMNRPRLLFLDEPTSALDPLGRREVRNIILALKGNGTTVFLNSHLLSEVEMVCDSVAIINQGTLTTQGNIKELLGGKLVVKIEVRGVREGFMDELLNLGKIIEAQGSNITLEIQGKETLPLIAKKVNEYGGDLYQLESQHYSLEDMFVKLIGEGEKC